jgi:hypothetical protein
LFRIETETSFEGHPSCQPLQWLNVFISSIRTSEPFLPLTVHHVFLPLHCKKRLATGKSITLFYSVGPIILTEVIQVICFSGQYHRGNGHHSGSLHRLLHLLLRGLDREGTTIIVNILKGLSNRRCPYWNSMKLVPWDRPEADLLDQIQRKVVRVFLLVIHSYLYSFP